MDRGDWPTPTAFVAVADQRSFRAAAAQLGVTPSALSRCLFPAAAGQMELCHVPLIRQVTIV
jgi:hypothetical protein